MLLYCTYNNLLPSTHPKPLTIIRLLHIYFCTITNRTAYIDYGNEPPPAATTSVHQHSRVSNFKDGRNRISENKVCQRNTCANKGVCYETYEDDIMRTAYVRQEELSNKDEPDSKWMSSALVAICDCDLTTYTGSTCEDGN